MATKTKAVAAEADAPEDDVEMGFFEHLAELRKRLVRAAWGMIPGIVIGAIFYEEIYGLLIKPFNTAWHQLKASGHELHGEFPTLISLTPFDLIVCYMKNAIVLGLVLGAPVVFWQVWAFIAPGLYRKEKRLAVPFAFFSGIFFMLGVSFGYFIVFPMVFHYFLSFSGNLAGSDTVVVAQYAVDQILSVELKLLLGFGIVFDLPVVISFLSAIGLVNWKQLVKFTPWWALIAAVLSALLTPPDPGSMIMMLVPLILLYFVSIIFAAIFGRKRDDLDLEPDPDE